MSLLSEKVSNWLDEPMEWLAIGLMVVMLGAIVISVPYGLWAWATYEPPKTFSLRIDSWECTQSHQKRVETCGAKTGCHWSTYTTCDQWSAK